MSIQTTANRLKRVVYPMVDPPDGDRHPLAPRRLTRDRTPSDPDEYVCSTPRGRSVIEAVLDVYDRHEFPTTLKYVREGEDIVYELASFAVGAWERSGGETMHHAYCFAAPNDSLHWHHHREWPVVHVSEHQDGSRTHGDPDGRLLDAFEDARVPVVVADNPEYVQA